MSKALKKYVEIAPGVFRDPDATYISAKTGQSIRYTEEGEIVVRVVCECGASFRVPSCKAREPSTCPKCGKVAVHRYY